ncbi:hypothetical protein V5F44_21100 [Xanthobacter sp. V2C-8]|uniref:hypothetical protein n=1 Tax=Xanthobacter albus TaxID=3119929 RepID=UPI0037273C64
MAHLVKATEDHARALAPILRPADRAAIKTFFSDLFSIPKEGYVKLPSQNR